MRGMLLVVLAALALGVPAAWADDPPIADSAPPQYDCHDDPGASSACQYRGSSTGPGGPAETRTPEEERRVAAAAFRDCMVSWLQAHLRPWQVRPGPPFVIHVPTRTDALRAFRALDPLFLIAIAARAHC